MVFLRYLGRLGRNERGAFLPLFAIMAALVIATIGAVVDFAYMQQVKTSAQIALDGAVVALQPDIYTKDEASLTSEAQTLLRARLNIPPDGGNTAGPSAEISEIEVDKKQGALYMLASLRVPTYFLPLVGVNSLDIEVEAQARRGLNNIDVAFVLDNSKSMRTDNRLERRKNATKCAVNILFYPVESCDASVAGLTASETVRVAVVPFAAQVNVGAHFRSAPWMDQDGLSPVSWGGPFDDDDDASYKTSRTINRFALFDQLDRYGWGGCVEARPYPLNTEDTPPRASDPNTLFVPSFAPDEPDDGSGHYNNYLKDQGGKCVYKANLDQRSRQERLCKYRNPTYWNSPEDGPNYNCIATPLLPLSRSPKDIIDKIEEMDYAGGTNIHMGTVWGYRALTPGEPLANTAPKGAPPNKILIVMTDGENELYRVRYSINGSTMSSYGLFYYVNLSGPRFNEIIKDYNHDMLNEMDELTVETCNNAKEDGITVFAIGISPSGGPNGKTASMLRACASDDEHVFFPQYASELSKVFTEIAHRTRQIRLDR